MKRSLQGSGELDSVTIANCLMLLSKGGSFDTTVGNNNPSRVFECKTCNRQFPSFQALGGHRASHKRPRLMGGEGEKLTDKEYPSLVKPKMHECSICGLEFAVGQALGGHMRRHRAGALSDQNQLQLASPPNLSSTVVVKNTNNTQVPVVKKSNSRRVFCLDLNLTPMENDLELFKLQKAVAMVDCFL